MKRWLTWFGLLLATAAFGRAVALGAYSSPSTALAWPPSWQSAAVTLAYDADGNRVKKTVTPASGQPTNTTYLVEDRNPTGYAQVMEETTFTPPATTGLTGYWALDEGTGTAAADASGNNHAGTLLNDVSWTGGRSGSGALKFDGVNDWVAMTGTAGSYSFIQNTLVFTVAGWLKLEGDRSARQAIMLNNVYSAERGFFFAWETYGGGYGTKALRFAAWKGTSGIPVIDAHCNDNATINDNNWHHVAAVGNGSQITFYVDGQAKTTTYLTAFQGYSTGNSYGDLNLGAFSTGILPLNGSLDDMRIYSRELSAEEIGGLAGTRVRYVYGLDLVSQARNAGTGWTTNYYGYDGLGSVRYLTDASGVVTDTYTYDAFGILIGQTPSTGQTVNNYRYTGEQWDGDLGMYCLRARYLNPTTGRFWTVDSFEGSQSDPLSLHKYLYCHGDPVNGIDPSGNMTIIEFAISTTTALAVRAPFVLPTLYAAQRAAARINVVALANAFRSLYFGVGNQISRIPVNIQTGQQFERMLNPAMRLLGGVKGQSVQAMFNGATRTAWPDWVLWSKHLVDAKLGQAINVTGQQFQVMLSWAARQGGSVTYITLNKPPATVITDAINAGNAVGVNINFWHILPW